MTLYTALESPDGTPDRVIFVPEGFSWSAFAFSLVWSLWHRMWVVAALLLVAFSALGVLVASEQVAPAVAVVVVYGIMLMLGLEGRFLRVLSLERAGFRVAGLVEASCLESAELAYFADRRIAVQEQRPGPSEDVLGIFGNV